MLSELLCELTQLVVGKMQQILHLLAVLRLLHLPLPGSLLWQ